MLASSSNRDKVKLLLISLSVAKVDVVPLFTVWTSSIVIEPFAGEQLDSSSLDDEVIFTSSKVVVTSTVAVLWQPVT